MDIGPYDLPETSTVNIEISPLLRGFIGKFRSMIAQAGILWLKLLCVMAERPIGGPGSRHARRVSAVLQSQLAETYRIPAAPEGQCCLKGERSHPSAGAVSLARQALTIVSLPDGHGAAGLQDRERSRECILQAVSRPTPHARVFIIP